MKYDLPYCHRDYQSQRRASEVILEERLKVQKDAVFVLVTDERDRELMNIDTWDVVISWNRLGTRTLYDQFAGKMLSLRRLTQIGIESDIANSKMMMDKS